MKRIPTLIVKWIANKLGYKNGQFISNVERGLCSIPVKKINALALEIDCSAQNLITAILKDEVFYLKQMTKGAQ